MFNFLPKVISSNGLSVLILDGLPQGIVLDVAALMRVLDNSDMLTRLNLRNLNLINSDSLDNLIDMTCAIIQRDPPKLVELDFGGFGATLEQGERLLETIYESRIQLKKLDLSDNP